MESLLGNLGLSELLNNLPAELSVGQQQRVAVARTLINEPMLILADEPTGDVDAETGKEVIKLLLVPVKEKGATLIVATHGIFAPDIANRLFQLVDGVLVPQT